jgi:hypothetical protein
MIPPVCVFAAAQFYVARRTNASLEANARHKCAGCAGQIVRCARRIVRRNDRSPRFGDKPFILILLVIGAYAFDNNIVHSVMLVLLGGFAYLLERFGFPAVPIILGFVMGPIIEENLSRAMIIARGDWSLILQRPITLGILALAVATAVFAYRRGRSYV